MIDSWNHMTAVWLRYYVYERCPKIFYPSLVTFMVSAFWHGFYPTYYVFFINAWLLTESARIVYKNKNLFSFIPPSLRGILAIFISSLSLSIHGIAFGLLVFEKAHIFYSAIYYKESMKK